MVPGVLPLAVEHDARERVALPQALDLNRLGDLGGVLVGHVARALDLAVVGQGLRNGRDREQGLGGVGDEVRVVAAMLHLERVVRDLVGGDGIGNLVSLRIAGRELVEAEGP